MALIDIAFYNSISGESVAVDDVKMLAVINFISQAMVSFCNRILEATDFTYIAGDDFDDSYSIFDGPKGDTFYFPTYPVNSIATILVNDEAIIAATGYSDTSGYHIYPDSGKLVYALGFSHGYPRNLKVAWNGGYAADSPEMFELKMLCYELVRVMNNPAQTNPIFESEKIGSYSYKTMNVWLLNKLQGMSPMVFARLGKYKREVFV